MLERNKDCFLPSSSSSAFLAIDGSGLVIACLWRVSKLARYDTGYGSIRDVKDIIENLRYKKKTKLSVKLELGSISFATAPLVVINISNRKKSKTF